VKKEWGTEILTCLSLTAQDARVCGYQKPPLGYFVKVDSEPQVTHSRSALLSDRMQRRPENKACVVGAGSAGRTARPCHVPPDTVDLLLERAAARSNCLQRAHRVAGAGFRNSQTPVLKAVRQLPLGSPMVPLWPVL